MSLDAARWLTLAAGLGACTAITDLDSLQGGSASSGGVGGGATGTTTSAASGDTASSGTGVSPGELSFTDDALAGEFGEGTFSGVVWNEDHLELDGQTSGVFVSRTFDAGADARWPTLAYSGAAPYGK